MAKGEPGAIIFAQVTQGGIANKVRRSIEVRADGSVTGEVLGDGPVAATLSDDAVAIIDAACRASGFDQLPEFVETPLSRSDVFSTVFTVGSHEVKILDLDNLAPDDVPPPLRLLDELAATIMELAS